MTSVEINVCELGKIVCHSALTQHVGYEMSLHQRVGIIHGDDVELKLPRKASLCIMLTMNVLLQVSEEHQTLVISSESSLVTKGVILHHRLIIQQVCRVFGR